MSKSSYLVADFQIQGQLLGFISKNGEQIKYLKIALEQKEYWLKLPKKLRHQIDQTMVPGCWLDIRGSSKKCRKTGKLKLKALEVKLAQSEKESLESIPQHDDQKTPVPTSKMRILVCNKSSCRKRGSKALCQALKTQLKNYNLAGNTEIKLTGCLKKCKQGPNLVITPHKTRYSEVTPEQIPRLLAHHLSLET